jgi:hypothetical protein
MTDFSISTFIINLPERKERLENVLAEFNQRNEFDIKVVPAFRHKIGAQGLWTSLCSIVAQAQADDEDVIIVCEDDHQFTNHYSKELLYNQIKQAFLQHCDILAGGISGGFGCAFPVAYDRFWVDGYHCNQFIVLFKTFFSQILKHQFDQSSKVDMTISGLTPNKMVMYPFVSTQKFFGYSDVTKYNERNPEWALNRFNEAEERLSKLHKIYYYYHKK